MSSRQDCGLLAVMQEQYERRVPKAIFLLDWELIVPSFLLLSAVLR
jgi:hypothetical protein